MHQSRYLANIYFWNKAYRKHNDKERFEVRIPEDWALEIIDEDEWNMLNKLSEK